MNTLELTELWSKIKYINNFISYVCFSKWELFFIEKEIYTIRIVCILIFKKKYVNNVCTSKNLNLKNTQHEIALS